MNNNILPWHIHAWERFQERRKALPHALLLKGRSGLGKTILARAFAQALLCERATDDGHACGACSACNWFSQGNHPDFRQVEPEVLSAASSEEAGSKSTETLSRQIKIDQIRDLQPFLTVGTHRGGLRVVIVRPAEAMNIATANALLKSLEEPAPKTVFLLVTSEPQRLLPTIRSRCQVIEVAPPDLEAAAKWLREQGIPDPADDLAFAGRAPLTVLEQAEGAASRARLVTELLQAPFAAVPAADRCAGLDPTMLAESIQKWVYDLASVKMDGPARYHPRHQSAIRQLCTGLAARPLLGFARELCRAKAVSQHPLNPRLYMEDLFIRYQRLTEDVDV